MATVASLGTGSGLELEALVTKLMAVEQQPLTRLQEQETAVQTKISALGTLKSSLEALQESVAGFVLGRGETASTKYASFSASSSTTTVATVSAQSDAVAGSHTLSVTTIASAQQIRKSISSSDIPSVAGSLNIQIGNNSAVSVSLDAGSSLDDVASAINDASAGVTASIITSGTTSYLALTADDTGASNTISVSASDTGDTSGTEWSSVFDYSSSTANSWSVTATAADASLTIDGLAVSSASNTLSNISGLSVTLVGAGDTTLTVTKDNSTQLNTLITAFVSAYNLSNTSMSELGAYDAESEEAGDLQGNSTLRSARTQTRALLFSITTGGTSSYQTLSDIGVSVQDDGSLEVDSSKLSAALKADSSAVATLMTKLGTAFDTTLDNIVSDDGSIASAVDGLNTTIDRLESRQEDLQDRLDKIEEMYRAKFTALDTMLAELQSTSTYLTQLFASDSSSS